MRLKYITPSLTVLKNKKQQTLISTNRNKSKPKMITAFAVTLKSWLMKIADAGLTKSNYSPFYNTLFCCNMPIV